MVQSIFLQIVKMSLSAALVAGAVMLLRLVFRKAPRAAVCALWALVALRLILPALPESRISVVPEKLADGSAVTTITEQNIEKTVRVKEADLRFDQIRMSHPEVPVREEGGERYLEVSEKTGEVPKTFENTVLPVLPFVWIAGAALMLLYMLVSYGRMKRRTAASIRLRDSVYLCDSIDTPFVLGTVRPRIYLPSGLSEEQREYVLAHEQAHLARLDHIWKPFGFVLLAVHWFNPVLWAAYLFFCRDIELACDEKVIKDRTAAYRKEYSEALLEYNRPGKALAVCPLFFGEVAVGTRIKALIRYRKPAFWTLLAVLAAGLVTAGCALTDPSRTSEPSETLEQTVSTEALTEAQPSQEVESPEETSSPAETAAPTESSEAATVPAEPSEESSSGQEDETPYTGQYAAERIFFLSREEIEGLSDKPFSPSDYVGETDFGFGLLDTAGKRIIWKTDRFYNYTSSIQGESVLHVFDLDFMEAPRQICADAGLGQGYYILDQEVMYRISLDHSKKEVSILDKIPLPDVTAEDVRDMQKVSGTPYGSGVLLIMKDGDTNYLWEPGNTAFSPTEEGYRVQKLGEGQYRIIERDGREWTVSLPLPEVQVIYADYDGRWYPYNAGLLLFNYEVDGQTAQLRHYDPEGKLVSVSELDTSDWLSVPERISGEYKLDLYMVPRADGVSLYGISSGYHILQKEPVWEDLTAYEKEILSGRILPVGNGGILAENEGFRIDLDQDGKTDEIKWEACAGRDGSIGYSFYYNGRNAGYELNEQLEDNFYPKDAGYRLCLVSLDGRTISVVMSSEERMQVVDFIYAHGDNDALILYARVRMRSEEKTIDELIPCSSLAEYIAQGWECRPSYGDLLDIDGDGKEENVYVRYFTFGYSYFEELYVGDINGRDQATCVMGCCVMGWNVTDGYQKEIYRFRRLYYSLEEAGEMQIIGEGSSADPHAKAVYIPQQFADGWRYTVQ
ncbi:MAG: hypothetical protein II882_09865 [Lachnospiraceae bacterium]|nr:hypothetical protein [Lachnospiraceae bacterium]